MSWRPIGRPSGSKPAGVTKGTDETSDRSPSTTAEQEKECKNATHDHPASQSTADLKVKTLDSVLDMALGGGFQPGHITEIVGESAVGKTQFVLGLLRLVLRDLMTRKRNKGARTGNQ